MTPGRIALHIKPFSSRKNEKGIIRNPTSIVLTYYREGEAGTLERILRHRGISCIFLATRDCSDKEFQEEYEPYWRYRFLHYENWDLLFSDEEKFVNDQAFDQDKWFAQLWAIRAEWPHLELKESKAPYKPLEAPEQLEKKLSKLLARDPHIRLEGFE